MSGFWINPTDIKKAKQAKVTRQNTPKVTTCPCGLQNTCLGPMMEVGGNGKRGILVLAEAPGREEDEAYARLIQSGQPLYGTQLIGTAGRLLESRLARVGIDLNEDCFKFNAINCRPPDNRTPTGAEVIACRPRVLEVIRTLKPRYILALGGIAVESLIAHKWHDEEGLGGINRWRGLQCPDQEYKAWICPTYHPSYVSRCEKSKQDKQVPLYFDIDLEKFAELINYDQESFPYYPMDDVVIYLTIQETIGILRKLLTNPPELLYFDYETTGLKPHTPGHKIVSVSICFDGEVSYSFLLTPEITSWWVKILQSSIPKAAHKIQFEEKWSRAILGVEVNNWTWDTCLAAHVMDNRGQISNLKFQTYSNFGIPDYSSEIYPYLKSKHSLGINNIDQIPVQKLLKYGGLDSYFGYLLWEKQKRETHNYNGIKFLVEGAKSLMDDEENGVSIDLEYIKKQKEFIQRRIGAIEKRILDSNEGQIWKTLFPNPNLNSNPQLAKLLYEKLGYTPLKRTKKGNASVDEEALETMSGQIPLVQDIVEKRKLEKISSTYLSNWEEETGPDHILRPFYNLNIVRTFRSSSSNPNLQNVPIRDKDAQRATRRAVRPRAGHVLVEADFSGVEVRVSACYHKDPKMLEYITDPTTDMHRDMAMECYMLELDEMDKTARQGAKNQFVFPEFYGSYWVNTGPGLWKWAETAKTKKGLNLIKHLKKKGITSLGEPDNRNRVPKGTFLYHIREVEQRFWGERFKVYAEWKETFYKQYLRKGFFDTLTGFTCQGPMRKNEVVNYPIQGSAFHCLLQSKINTKHWIEEMGYSDHILPCGQVHDSGLFSVDPGLLDEFAQAIYYIWKDLLREQWSWIIVPLDVEIDVTPVNGSWYEKQPYKGV